MSKVILRSSLVLTLILAAFGLAYLGSTVLSSSSKGEKSIVRVVNSTLSCDVLSAEKHSGNHLKVRVQNNNSKGITAFVLTSRIDSRTVFAFKEEFAFSEANAVIAPGDSYDKLISIPDVLGRKREITLKLSAVFFEDKSSEGDAGTVREVEDNRLGEKIQLMKALTVLDKISGLSEADIGSYWSKTARRDLQVVLDTPDTKLLTSLNNKTSNEEKSIVESEQFQLGAQAGKEYVLQKYQELRDIQERQGITALREAIIGVKDLYATMTTKF